MLPVVDGINVTVGSVRSAERAAAVTAQVQALALPAFTRVRNGEWHQVVVGPYATETEAATAQRGLAAHGFTGSAVAAESASTLRNRASTRWRPTPARCCSCLPIVCRSCSSCREEPKKVAANTVDGSTLQIDVGPVTARHQAERLNAATGVPVIANVTLQRRRRGGPGRR